MSKHQRNEGAAFLVDDGEILKKIESLPPGPVIMARNEPDLRDLLAWVSKNIVRRNVNGKFSEKFCLICTSTKVRRDKCRHAEIWALTKPDAVATIR